MTVPRNASFVVRGIDVADYGGQRQVQVRKNVDVWVRQGRIQAIGTALHVPKNTPVLRYPGAVLHPPGNNAWFYPFQAATLGFHDISNVGEKWMDRVVAVSRSHSPQDRYRVALDAYANMAASGVTETHSMNYADRDLRWHEAEMRAAQDAGVRDVHVMQFADRPSGSKIKGLYYKSPQQALRQARIFLERNPQGAVGGLSVLATSKELIRGLVDLAREKKTRFYMLLGEDPAELEKLRKDYPRSKHPVLDFLKETGLDAPHVVLSNLVHVHDIKVLKHLAESGVTVVESPYSNFRGSGVTDVTRFTRLGIPWRIGTCGTLPSDFWRNTEAILHASGAVGENRYLFHQNVWHAATQSISNPGEGIRPGALANFVIRDPRRERHNVGGGLGPEAKHLLLPQEPRPLMVVSDGKILVENGTWKGPNLHQARTQSMRVSDRMWKYAQRHGLLETQRPVRMK